MRISLKLFVFIERAGCHFFLLFFSVPEEIQVIFRQEKKKITEIVDQLRL